MIDPRALLSFLDVLTAGSFSAAARATGWTQPALSNHVRALETRLGVRLLVRSPQGVTATEAGRILCRHAQVVAERLRDAECEVRQVAESAATTLSILAFPSACVTILAPTMARLAEGPIALEVRLSQMEPPESVSALGDGTADAGILFRYAQDEPGDESALVLTLLGVDRMMLIAPRGLRLGEGPESPVALRDAEAFTWVSGCVTCRAHLARMAAREGFVPDVRHMSDDYMVVQELVARDRCVALVPELALRSACHAGIDVHPLANADARNLFLAVRPGDGRAATARFAAVLADTARDVLATPWRAAADD